MFGPLLAAVVMRLAVSREGIKSTLGIWRSWRYYLVAFAVNILLLAFPFTWLYIASRGSPFVTAVCHAALNAAGDTFTTPAHIPYGNPLIVGGGGLVTAALMLAIVAVWYGILKC